MATYYVSSVIGNSAFNGTTWALAKPTVTEALALATTTGDIIYVDSAHSESSGADIAWNVPTAETYVSIISVNRAGSVTTGHSGWLKGAAVTISANTFGIGIATTGAQNVYIYGFVFTGHTGSSNLNHFSICGSPGAVLRSVTLEECDISTPGTSTVTMIQLGNTANVSQAMPIITFKNVLLAGHNSTSAGVVLLRNADFRATGLTIAYNTAKPGLLVDFIAGVTALVDIRDSDLSGYENSSGTLFSIASLRQGQISLRNCKLSPNPTKTPSGTWQSNAVFVQYVNVDSGDTKTTLAVYNRLGTMLSTESVYRTTSPAYQIGSVPVGLQIVTTADCNPAEPFIARWFLNGFDTNTSSVTATVKIIHDSATNLNDKNLWSDVEYVSSASFPLGSLVSSRSATPMDGSATDHASDSDTWVGTGGFANANKQKVEKVFVPAEGSVVGCRLSVGIASKTLYVDPQVIIT